jgi:polar amino acid transport system permease protein
MQVQDIVDFLLLLLKGAFVTGKIVVLAFALSLVVAFVIGLMGCSRHFWIRWLSTIYIEFIRGTSALVQLFWCFFVLPFFGITLEPITTGVLVLGCNVGAFSAEIVRGAILAVPRVQIEACLALSFSPWQSFFHVVLPQALIRMLPPMGNQAVDTIKLSSLVSLITIHDLTFIANVFRTNTGLVIEPFLCSMVVYFLYASCAIGAFRWLEKRAIWKMDSPKGRG